MPSPNRENKLKYQQLTLDIEAVTASSVLDLEQHNVYVAQVFSENTGLKNSQFVSLDRDLVVYKGDLVKDTHSGTYFMLQSGRPLPLKVVNHLTTSPVIVTSIQDERTNFMHDYLTKMGLILALEAISDLSPYAMKRSLAYAN